MKPRARPPFDSWPVQERDPRFGYAWWRDPAVLVTQAIVDRGTLDAAKAVQGFIDDALEHAAADVKRAGGLLVLHDWRTVETYDGAGRSYYLERMRARPRDYLRHTITVVRDGAFFRIAVGMANLVARVTAHAEVELAHDVDAAVAKLGIRPPPIGGRFPGR